MNTIYIYWHGPFSLGELQKLNQKEPSSTLLSGCGLYAITGMTKWQRYPRLQYIGITEVGFLGRTSPKTHKIWLVTREQAIWLGKVAYKKCVSREDIELAESMMVYFSEPPGLSERKTKNHPVVSCSVISSFFKKNTGKVYKRLPGLIRAIPELVMWDVNSKILRYSDRLQMLHVDSSL